MVRASMMNRALRFGVLPAVLSLTACGGLEVAPTAPEPLTLQEQGVRGESVNVLHEGGFEYGTTAWAADPEGVLTLQGGCAEASPHEGMGWARFGASEAGVETLSQIVTVPKGRARLEFYLYDAALGDATLEALVDGQVLFSYTGVGTPVVVEDGLPVSALSVGKNRFTEGYEKVRIDVSSFADGGPHTVTFRVADGTSGTASLSVDDAALTVELLRDLIPALSQNLNALKLPKAVSKPLTVRLERAAAALARNRAENAVGELKAFTKEVRGHRGKRIKAPAADALIREARAVTEVIN